MSQGRLDHGGLIAVVVGVDDVFQSDDREVVG